MKLLVIGGSYFYGRVFVMLAAKEHEVTVVNRGTYSVEELGARQIKGDRHDPALWEDIKGSFDAVVDFCGYEPGDIRTVLEHFDGTIRQYIFISTVDVYQRGTGIIKTEEAPLETRRFPGETGAYIAGKVELEQELVRECEARGILWTVLRPAILYGPFNYAPRESAFIGMAVQQRIVPRFADADGRFQFVYVKDAAEAVLRCLGNRSAGGQAYNLCGDEVLDYEIVLDAIAARAERESATSVEGESVIRAEGESAADVERPQLTLAEAESRGIPVSFPAAEAETELVDGRKSREELGVSYTSFEMGMDKTYAAFSRIYREA